jgi:RHS repeat-associated protein
VEYVDAPIIRYRDGNVNGDYGDEGNSLLYYLHDANFNVIGLVSRDDTGVVERYMYEPYGDMKVLDADWGEDANNTSDFDNEVLYCGYRRDAESALYHVRHRYYHPTLGRWISRDPLLLDDAGHANLYLYGGAVPTTGADWSGLKKNTCERVLDVDPGAANAFAWSWTKWRREVIMPHPIGISVPGDPGTNWGAGVQAAIRWDTYRRRYRDLYKCCDVNDNMFYKWGNERAAEFDFNTGLIYPISGGLFERSATFGNTGTPTGDIKWDSDYAAAVGSGFKHVQHVCCKGGGFTTGKVPSPPPAVPPPPYQPFIPQAP